MGHHFQHAHFIPLVGGERERCTLIGPWWDLLRQHPFLELPSELLATCAGGLSAVKAIGTQLRDSIISRLTQWRMAV